MNQNSKILLELMRKAGFLPEYIYDAENRITKFVELLNDGKNSIGTIYRDSDDESGREYWEFHPNVEFKVCTNLDEYEVYL